MIGRNIIVKNSENFSS